MHNDFSRRTFLRGFAATMITSVSAKSVFGAQPPLFFNPTSRPIGLQMYTLGDEPAADLDAVFAQVAQIGYRDFELPGFYGRAPADIKAAADRAGLDISSLHLPAMSFSTDAALTLQSDPQQVPDILAAADAAGVRHFYVEQEPPFEMPRMESITRSYQYLSQLRVGA